MDQHYDWSNSEFSRVGKSLNLAVNYLADVLHGFWLASGQSIPEFEIPHSRWDGSSLSGRGDRG